MRIVVVATQIDVPGSGGGQTHVSELVANLRKHAPTQLIARRGSHGPDVIPAGFWKGLPPRGLAHAFSGLNLARCFRDVKRFQPNVIYERGSSYGLGTYLSLALDLPMVVMLLDHHISPLSLVRASRIITTDTDLVPRLFRHKAVSVRWGANTDHFDMGIDPAPARKELGLEDSTVVAYTGTLQPWHGIDKLIDAADMLEKRNLKFLIIGGRPERLAKVKKSVSERGLERAFIFTGQVPYGEVPRLLSAADMCVAPFDPGGHGKSRKRGYSLDPLKLFEYLAMAKPTITIRAENIERLFDDKHELLLTRAGDAKELADAIAWVCDNEHEAKEMAQRGYEKVVERYTWQAHAKQLVGLFDEMLEEQASRPRSSRRGD